jgi:choline dehydrogenase-like flavoprotein
MPEHYDVIVIGTGAGGGTLANTLAPSGKRILLLERGNFLPRETQNWDPESVFVDGRYISPETSFFPSIGAVNPALTAMANGIRVGEHLVEGLR